MILTRKAMTTFAAASLALSGLAFGQADNTITEDDVIVGTMQIDYNTRTMKDTSGDLKEGSAAKGAKDKYKVDITVAKTTAFTGEVRRQPNLLSKLLAKKQQSAQIEYSLDLSVINPKDPKQKKVVGKWAGTVPIDEASGAYDLAGGAAQESALRMKVDAAGAASGFEEKFGGRLMGKALKKENLAEYTFKRLIGDREVKVVVKKADPMRFEQIKLAKGPSENYPNTIVNGRLDYDYETSNWYTDGIRFSYTADGKTVEDVLTGSIKWVEDPQRASNGKGYYEFNLRFNEEKNKAPKNEADAFKKMSDEDAFFAVDNTIPCLTGRISYVDSMVAGSDLPASSKVTYNLHANKLTKQQIVNFFKLWMICVGPTNDE